jgi:hypothetical protein
MNTWTLKALTDTSYILNKDGINHSIVTLTEEGLKAIGPLDQKLFPSTDDLEKYLGSSLSVEIKDTDSDDGEEIGNIEGYPIKHKTACDIETVDTNNKQVITYAKITKSKARFAAGYYALLFDNGWTGSYCPRIQTLENYEFIGPFYSKLEMQNSISQKKRQSKV